MADDTAPPEQLTLCDVPYAESRQLRRLLNDSDAPFEDGVRFWRLTREHAARANDLLDLAEHEKEMLSHHTAIIDALIDEHEVPGTTHRSTLLGIREAEQAFAAFPPCGWWAEP